MKKTPRQKIIKKLDDLVRKNVKSKGHCERCFRKADEVQLQVAHIYSRKYNHLRWDYENLLCLCASCHFWWHLNPAEAIIWVGEIRDLNYLKTLRQNVRPIKTFELEQLYKLRT